MNLALFFTRNISLEIWLKSGLFDREKIIYEDYINKGLIESVYWLTYGSHDREIAEGLVKVCRLNKHIKILPKPKIFFGRVGNLLYSFLMPLIHNKILKTVDVLKTNQFDGSWSAVIAKKIYKKPLLIRAGYILSQLNKNQLKKNKIKTGIYQYIERIACKNANHIVVSSEHNKNYLMDLYHINTHSISTIYSYIDTKFFYNKKKDRFIDRLLFVGRLSTEKNLVNLVKAIKGMNLKLDLVGEGYLKEELSLLATNLGIEINFLGSKSNSEMPDIYNNYNYFILPSIHEGMPKVLIEAMACGCICIGTNVGGIGELINHGKTGYLINGTGVEDIQKMLAYAIQQKKIELNNGLTDIVKNHTIESVIEKEYKILKNITHSR